MVADFLFNFAGAVSVSFCQPFAAFKSFYSEGGRGSQSLFTWTIINCRDSNPQTVAQQFDAARHKKRKTRDRQII
jgi:hypothetical protein